MKIRVMLFAAAKQLVGRQIVEIEVPCDGQTTVANLKSALEHEFPQLQGLLSRSSFAIDSQWAESDAMIKEESQVAMIPPVSGG